MLSESFSFCEAWLTYSRKHKKEIYPEGYLYVAIFCGKFLTSSMIIHVAVINNSFLLQKVTLSLKLCLRDDRNLKPKPKMWNNLVVEVKYYSCQLCTKC